MLGKPDLISVIFSKTLKQQKRNCFPLCSKSVQLLLLSRCYINSFCANLYVFILNLWSILNTDFSHFHIGNVQILINPLYWLQLYWPKTVSEPLQFQHLSLGSSLQTGSSLSITGWVVVVLAFTRYMPVASHQMTVATSLS